MLQAKLRAAMAAGIVEGPHDLIAVTQQQDRLVADGFGAKRAGLWQRIGPAEIDPLPIPDGRQFLAVDSRVVISHRR
jgi:hypothetical protein